MIGLGLGLGLSQRQTGGGVADPVVGRTALQGLFSGVTEAGWLPHPSTCFTDVEGTTPATVGDPVAYIEDSIAGLYPATQATLAHRPILRQDAAGLYYLEGDGISKRMSTASIDFSASDEMTVFTAVRKDLDHTGSILELSERWFDVSNNGTATIFCSDDGTYSAAADGTISFGHPDLVTRTDPFIGADTAVLTSLHDISDDTSIIRRNGTEYAAATEDKGAGNFGNYPIYLLHRGDEGGSPGFFFDGRFYGGMVAGTYATAGEIATGESAMAERCGETL